MSDLDRAVSIARVVLQAVEILEVAVKAASTALAAGKAPLKAAIDEYEERHDTLKTDRDAADQALNDKFDKG